MSFFPVFSRNDDLCHKTNKYQPCFLRAKPICLSPWPAAMRDWAAWVTAPAHSGNGSASFIIRDALQHPLGD